MVVNPKSESFFQIFLWIAEWLVSKEDNPKARIKLLIPIYAREL